ncbi:ATP-binding protein [Acinetobacter sp. SwsAc6]|uniref:sensor histidine kinase n=1 Tax=Acinetobacter TaxID=469 RepID=UPI000EA1C75E|nr:MULTISPECIES: ATP-binding protein [Acinetobacter]NWK73053.1 ATP-binding protein [Acinetobacter sp. SwsAc6]RKG50925.1 ATP-binding protein [Acinetobacter cumulans]
MSKLKFTCLLLWFICSFSFASENFVINQQCQVIVKNIQKAQTPSIDSIPTQGWEDVAKLPDRWSNKGPWKDYVGGAWYRVQWHWQCQNHEKLKEPIAFSLDYINVAGAVYLNGDMLWRDQNLVEPLSKSWNIQRSWILPISGLRTHENEIMIYVTGYSDLGAGVGKIDFNNVVGNSAMIRQKTWDHRTLFQINSILSSTLGIICLIIWLFRPKETSFGWFALSSLFWVLFITNILISETAPYPNTVVMIKFNMICLVLYLLTFSTYLVRFIEQKHPRLEKVLLCITAVSLLAIALTGLSTLNLVVVVVLLFYILLFLCVYFYLCIMAFRKKRGDFIFLACCMTVVLLLGLFDLVVFVVGVPYEVTSLTPYTSPIVTIFIVVILGGRLNRNIKKVEDFNNYLATKVEEVSANLSKSLNEQHQLELSNARLHERMDLSHDLHDGLGASLVRSMIIVDQCEHQIPNQQFLSMLKLLRDDLRQIIDTGSAEGSRVPDSPVLWLAPVRYRFNLLLDELNIRVAWHVAPSWVFQPTALQCLTLIRILEESLVNVVKHSQATSIVVSLNFTATQQLELTVQDDGVGFDVECVNQNGMSIGVRSMKTRAERMGATFSIQSASGCTRIQVLIDAPIDENDSSV